METKNKTKKERFLDRLCIVWIVLSLLIIFPLSFQELGIFNLGILKTISKLKLPWQKNDEVLVLGIKEKIYSVDEFVINIGKKADSLGIKNLTEIRLEKNESVAGTDEEFAKIEPFKEEWEFTELDPILKEFELTVTDEVGLMISHYDLKCVFFPDEYGPGNKFKVYPRPKYIVYFDGKIYLLGQELGMWHRRY